MATQVIPNRPETADKKTTVGSYFVSNYPPYSFWNSDCMGEFESAIHTQPADNNPLGLYIHIPFCRRRCSFCYFRVYTDKNASEIRRYMDGVINEFEMYANQPFVGNRKPSFVYFGGGTPSYLSVNQLKELTDRLKGIWSWEEAEEVTFECEPGTLAGNKLEMIREIGVTRLSLGVENFDDELLELNGRAHRSPEIYRAYQYARELGFPQINIDLIAGMVGETEENWQRCIEKTLELQPDIITIYQMEVPFNTIIYREMKEGGRTVAPVADWETKRRWVSEAFGTLEENGYRVTSAYTAVKNDSNPKFLYRDYLWRGADLLGLGVASFSHVNGTHFQNDKDFAPYLETVGQEKYPIRRAYSLNEEEKFLREFLLQMKLGHVHSDYFMNKYNIDILRRFEAPLNELTEDGFLNVEDGTILLTRDGLLQVDSLLPNFYMPEHRDSRYT